jgi:Antibiotic biosynthesis monooxygenase
VRGSRRSDARHLESIAQFAQSGDPASLTKQETTLVNHQRTKKLGAPAMAAITTIVHFSLPKENMDELLVIWKKIRDIMLNQPGALEGIFHRTIDEDSAFQFVNVARWESAEALADALRRGNEEGSDLWTLNQELRRLGARVSQNNYVQEVKY